MRSRSASDFIFGAEVSASIISITTPTETQAFRPRNRENMSSMLTGSLALHKKNAAPFLGFESGFDSLTQMWFVRSGGLFVVALATHKSRIRMVMLRVNE